EFASRTPPPASSLECALNRESARSGALQMNATGDREENPELRVPGAPGLPLAAPAAAGVLSAREVNAYFRPPDDPPPHDPVPARPDGRSPRPGAHAPAAATAAQAQP